MPAKVLFRRLLFCCPRATGSGGSCPPGPPRSSFSPSPLAAYVRIWLMARGRDAWARLTVEILGREAREVSRRARVGDISGWILFLSFLCG